MIVIFDNFSISMEYQKDSTFDRGKETTAKGMIQNLKMGNKYDLQRCVSSQFGDLAHKTLTP